MLLIVVVLAAATTAPRGIPDPGGKVPPDFAIEDVAAAVTKLTVEPRGEFETTEQFQQRVAANGADDSIHAFAAEQSNVNLTYDADRGLFEGRLYFHSVFDDVTRKVTYVLVSTKERKTLDAYEASNAFGKKVQVQRFEETLHGVGLTKAIQPGTEFAFKMPPDIAKEAKPHIAAAFVCRLANTGPRAGGGTSRLEPKIDAPVDIARAYHFVRARDIALWIYNQETGEVYRHLTLQETR